MQKWYPTMVNVFNGQNLADWKQFNPKCQRCGKRLLFNGKKWELALK